MTPANQAPSLSTRLLFALLSARCVYGLTYLVGSLRRSPVPWYYPLERRWSFEGAPAAGLGMEWFGRTAAAILLAALVFGITWLATARGPAARALARPAVVPAVARAVGLMMLIDLLYFGWALMTSNR